MSFKRVAYALTGLVLSGAVAMGANAFTPFTGAQDPSQIFNYLNQLIAQLNTFAANNSAADFANPRNLLDNGQMQIQQRGTATRTCGTTTIPSSAYAADRWGCNVNVTSGAGTLQVITSNLPASPTFNAGMVFYRTSGALAQPQCVMQEIPTSKITPFQGQQVTVSAYIQGLAAMLAETTTVNAYLITGTGTDEGLQTFTATPAITPAFTGVASTQTAAFTITSSWARYNATFSVGSTVTEAALALCWTPTTGGTAGTTDGFRFTGAQLEFGVSASSFELRPYADDLKAAQSFFYAINEGTITAGTAITSAGNTPTTTTCLTAIPFPTTMFKAPIYSNALTASTFKLNAAAANTALSTPFSATTGANTIYNASVTFTASGLGATAGFACNLVSAAGSGTMQFTADF